MATKRKGLMISIYDEDLTMLEDICKDTGMGKSDVIRELISKCYVDEYCRKIITRNNFAKVAKKRMVGRTSHNVHYDNDEKNPTSHPVGEGERCPNDSPFPNDITEWEKDIERTIAIAKTPWIDDYDHAD